MRTCKMALLSLYKFFVLLYRRNGDEDKVQNRREKKAQVLVQIRLTAKAFRRQIVQTNDFWITLMKNTTQVCHTSTN